jgi:hypothetical protein
LEVERRSGLLSGLAVAVAVVVVVVVAVERQR